MRSKPPCRWLALLPAALLLHINFEGHAADFVWTNLAGGNWAITNNWSPNSIPGASDNAYITNNGTYGVLVNSTVTVATLTLGGTSGIQALTNSANTFTVTGPGVVNANGLLVESGGTLTGAGDLAINSPLMWSGGTISGAGQFTASGGVTLNSASTKTLSGRLLINTAQATWSAGSMSMQGGAVISNAASGTFDITDNLTLNVSGNSVFANAGMLRKTGGTGTAAINPILVNSGTVQVLSGLLDVSSSSTNTGGFSIASGATLQFDTGPNFLNAGSSISGAGTFLLSGGTMNLLGDLTVTGTNNLVSGTLNLSNATGVVVGNLTLNGATLGGNAALTVTNFLDWISGSITGTNSVTSTTTVTIEGGGSKTMTGRNLVNLGQMNWNNGTMFLSSGAVVSNAPGATLDWAFAGSVNGGSPALIANAGLFRMAVGTGTASINSTLSNSGTVQVLSGALSLNGSSDYTGAFVASSGGTLQFDSGTHNLKAGASLSGAGAVVIATTVNVAGNWTVTGTNFLNSGTLNLSNATGIVLGNFLLNGGTLGGNGSLTVTNLLSWTGSSITGSGPVISTATFSIDGRGSKAINGRSLVNQGQMNWNNGNLFLNPGAVISNANGATLNCNFDGSIIGSSGGGLLANNGLMLKNAATTSGQITCMVNNSGSVDIQSGNLALNGGGTNSGTYTAEAGTELDLGGGVHYFNAGSTVQGDGTFSVNGGTANLAGSLDVTGTNSFSGGAANFSGSYVISGGTLNISGGTANFNGNGTITPATLNLSGGTLAGTNDVTVSAPMNWTAGNISGSGTVTAIGGLNITGGSSRSLSGRTLNNSGSAIWSNGNLFFTAGGVLSNAPASTFDCAFDGSITGNNTTLIINAGLFRKTAGAGSTASSSQAFVNLNSGTVDIQTGTLALNSGGTNLGAYTVEAGATLNLSGGAHYFNAGSSVAGGGTFAITGGTANLAGSLNVTGTNSFSSGTANFSGSYVISGGTLNISGGAANFNGNGTITPAILNLNGGTLAGTNNVIVSAPMSWTTGTITGSGVVTAAGTLSISTTASKVLTRVLNNAGQAAWTNGTLFIGGGAVISNAAGATFDIQGDVSTVAQSAGRVIYNAGLLRKTAGTNTSTLSETFTNAGTVEIQSGTLNTGGLYIQTGGATLLDGGNLTLSQPFQILGGSLSGSNLVTGIVTNSGVVSPGASPGLLIITGPYVQTTNGALNIELAGTTPEVSYDQLVVSNTVSLAGALNISVINGFYPAPNATFTFLTNTAARSGTFATFNFPSNVLGFQLNYGADTTAVQVINTLPIISALTNAIMDEMTLFSLSVGATDADNPAQTLTYSLASPPNGASINSSSGLLTWTPDESQGPGTNMLTVLVTDNGSPNLTSTQAFQIVVHEINTAPSLTLPPSQTINELAAFSANATTTDSDLPANPLTFALVSGPSGLTVSPGGAIAWTPTEAQGPGVYSVSVSVTDTNADAANTKQLSATNSFTLTVAEMNTPPNLIVPATQTITEQTPLNVSASATDGDVPANTFSFSLNSPPNGMTIDSGTGAIAWTPTEDQGPSTNTVSVVVTDFNANAINAQHLSVTNTFTVIVNESNQPPVLSMPSNQTIMELALYTNSATATDPDLPANPLTFALVSAPSGMTINSASGFIAWTPSEAQGPSTYLISISVTDTNPAAINARTRSVTNSFTLIVNESNQPPVLTLPPNTNVNELAAFNASATATDPDLPANPLTYALVSAPSGMTINANSGAINWTPSETQGPSTNVIIVSVTDTNAAAINAKFLSVTNSFTLIVNEVNTAPVLAAISDCPANVGVTLTLTNTATDSDLPTNTLTFSLLSPPSGASIGSSSGVFTWRPGAAYSGTTNALQVRVADNGSPSLSATQSFHVTVAVLSPVVLSALSGSSTNFAISLAGDPGPDYTFNFSTNLAGTNWTSLFVTNIQSSPFIFTNSFPATERQRYYRVTVGP